MKHSQRILLSLLSSVSLWAAWPANGIAPLLFIAFVPLFLVEADCTAGKLKGERCSFFKFSFFSMLFFNLFTTWWIWFASPGGMIMAVVFNALFMAFVLQLFHITKMRLGNFTGYFSLIFYWVAFEYLHLNWELSYPWLSLGNGLAAWINMIQWYEYTGVLGGTCWILLVNILIVHHFQLYIKTRNKILLKKIIIQAGSCIALPILISSIIKFNTEEKGKQVNVVIVQPNIDPYNEKFGGMSSSDQLKKILSLAKEKTTANTDYIVCPETALPDGIWQHELQDHPHIQTIREFIKPYPAINFITGLSFNRYYMTTEAPTATARRLPGSEGFYDSYNTGMQIENEDTLIQLHQKSKLVIGVEKIPFSGLFGFFEKFAIQLGGASGSLGTQPSPSVFKSPKANVAPVICYESVYGEYLTEYIKQGADAIFIITNDGWWSDTPGYRQHCEYARLRAVETRRDIARSANTGISCFIDQLGNISQPTAYWVPAVISQDIHLNREETFYTKHGDYIGRAACIISFIFLAWTMLTPRKKIA